MKKIIVVFLFLFVAKPIIGMDVPKKFIQAAMTGNLEALQDLEPQISGPERSNILSNALHQAIKAKKYRATEYLLSLPDINVDVKVSGITPIHAAVRTNDYGIVLLLLRTNKVDATIKSDSTDSTPLIDAAALGNLNIVDSLLKESNAQKAINYRDFPAQFTALDYAEDLTTIPETSPERVPLIKNSMIQALKSFGAKTSAELEQMPALNALYQSLIQLSQQLNNLMQKLAAIK